MRSRTRLPLTSALAVLCVFAPWAAQAFAPLDDARARRDALIHYEAGTRALSTEHYQEAVEEFELAVKLDPLLVLAHYGLGQAQMALQDYPAAVRAYVGCSKAFHADLANDLERQSIREERLDSQIRATEDQIAILKSGRPASGFSHPLSSLNPAYLQRQLDTLRVLRRRGTTVAQPTPPWISVALGGAYFRQGAFADAEREYKAAVEVDAHVGEAHNNLAVVYLLTKRVEDADREIALAEKAGFKVPDGLKQDVARQRAAQPAAP